MDYSWVIGLTLVFWICELAPADSASQEWLSVPGTVWACAGDNVSLHWEYDEDLGVPKVVNVARSELTITLVSKIGTADARSHRPRATFLPNAGVAISNVTAGDSGKYESTVVFSDQHSLVDEATLIVYETCPDHQEFKKPDVLIMYSIPRNRTDFPVHFKARVPKSDPKVNCTLYVGHIPYGCESGEATVASAEDINVNITVKLSHPALGESIRSIMYPEGQEDTTTVSSSNSNALRAGSGSNLVPLVVVFGLLIVCLLLLTGLMIVYILKLKKQVKRQKVEHELQPPRTTSKEQLEPGSTTLLDSKGLPHQETHQEVEDGADDQHSLDVTKDKSPEGMKPPQSKSPNRDPHVKTPVETIHDKTTKAKNKFLQQGSGEPTV